MTRSVDAALLDGGKPLPDTATMDRPVLAALVALADQIAAHDDVVVRAPDLAGHLELVVPLPLQELAQGRAAQLLGQQRLDPSSSSLRRLLFRLHPVIVWLGPLQGGQHLFARRLLGGGWGYVALLPWLREPRVTMLLGVAHGSDDDARTVFDAAAALCWRHRERGEALAMALQESIRESGVRQVHVEPATQFFVTPSYRGPDRRDRQTPLLSRFSLVGRRQVNVTGQVRDDYYADRVASRYRVHFALLMGLSVVDAATTLWLVHERSLRELNPLLRISLDDSPFQFLAVKLFITAGFSALILLHQHFRWFGAVLFIALAAYAAVDLRALVLLTL